MAERLGRRPLPARVWVLKVLVPGLVHALELIVVVVVVVIVVVVVVAIGGGRRRKLGEGVRVGTRGGQRSRAVGIVALVVGGGEEGRGAAEGGANRRVRLSDAREQSGVRGALASGQLDARQRAQPASQLRHERVARLG